MATSQRCLSARPSDVAITSQVKQPNDISIEHRQDVSVLRLYNVLLDNQKGVWKKRNNDDLSLRLYDVSNMAQLKHPKTSRWNVAKTSQWCISTASY